MLKQLVTLFSHGTVFLGIFPSALPLSPLGDVQLSSVDSARTTGQSAGACWQASLMNHPGPLNIQFGKKGESYSKEVNLQFNL